MGRVPVAAAAATKGAPVPRDEVQEAVDKFILSASRSERITSEVCTAWPSAMLCAVV